MGTSIAMHAAQRTDALSAPVVLFERSELGAGSSGRSGAILRQLYADRSLAAMARDSLREYASFEGRVGRSVGFCRTGVLTVVGPDQTDWIERLTKIQEELSEIGIRIELIPRNRFNEVFPGLQAREGSVGVWEPDAGMVDPELTTAAFGALARQYGAVTRVGVEVTEIRIENGRVVGLETSEGFCTADKVVLVAGAWSKKLLASMGIDLPLRVVRPENHFVAMPSSDAPDEEIEEETHFGFDLADDVDRLADAIAGPDMDAQGLHPVLLDLEKGMYCRCEPHARRTRLGHVEYDQAVEVDPDELDEEVSAETQAWARKVLIERLPQYEDQPDAGSLAALYTLTPDAQPIIGEVQGIEGLIVVTGFSGHGFKLAPSVGVGVSELIFGEEVRAFDPEVFAPDRFTGDEEWGGQFGL